jgi:hypothetical protein
MVSSSPIRYEAANDIAASRLSRTGVRVSGCGGLLDARSLSKPRTELLPVRLTGTSPGLERFESKCARKCNLDQGAGSSAALACAPGRERAVQPYLSAPAGGRFACELLCGHETPISFRARMLSLSGDRSTESLHLLRSLAGLADRRTASINRASASVLYAGAVRLLVHSLHAGLPGKNLHFTPEAFSPD